MINEKKITILHIAYLDGKKTSGVSVVVPKHIFYQQMSANVLYTNLKNDEKIANLNNHMVLAKDLYGFFSGVQKPSLVIFHEVYYLKYLKIAKMLKQFEIPYIVVPHGCLTDGAQQKKKIKKAIFNWLLFNNFIKFSKGIQCLSAFEMANTHFDNYKFVSSNGFEICNDYKESQKNNAIVYIGRFDIYHKGLDLLIEAASICREQLENKGIGIFLYGPGDKNIINKLQKLIHKNGLEDIVFLNGPVFSEEKIKILKSSKVFIQTSRFEGMPLGILEALSVGLPCLVTEGTTLAEIINQYDAGWAAQNDVQSIAKAILLMIETDSKTMDKKSLMAQKLVKEIFDWKTISSSAINYYKEIAANKRENE